MKELLCKSKNDIDVFVDAETTNIGLHILEYPDLKDLITEVIPQVELQGTNIGIERDLGRTVGQTSCVLTTRDDEIVYAKRLERDSFSRFVKNRNPEDTQYVSIVLFEKDYGYLVWSAWCGRLVPTSPDSEGRMRTSEGFWRNHALVFDPSIIQVSTLTTERPASKRL